MDRRRAIRIAVAAAALAACGGPAAARDARAPGEFERFLPFLVDLAGWTGEKPHGLDMEVPGSRIVSASREYRRGGVRLGVAVVVGPTTQGVTAATAANVDLASGDTRMHAAVIDGLPASRSFTAHDRTGVILVALGARAMFSAVFEGLDEDEALGLAQRFDWKAIQAVVPK
jgi:hypothetical protein